MSDNAYTPPEVWSADTQSGGRFASINRPTAGAREAVELPRGEHPFQLYSLATPNGVKASILLEELLEAGETGAEYDAWTIEIGEGQQFGSGFVALNPNSKIPALLDQSGPEPIRVFESGAILLHLAERFGRFLRTDPAGRAETLSWLFWQVGSGPMIGGGFGHFYHYAPEKIEYAINRYAMETKRLFDVADKTLADRAYLAGDEYTIADMAVFPWFAPFIEGSIYGDARRFLSVSDYTNVARWVDNIANRPAVQRGRIVCKTWGDEDTQLRERHGAGDFAGKRWSAAPPS